MTPLRATLASLLTRRLAAAAALVTIAGGVAGGAAFAIVNTSAPAPVAQELAASSAADAAPATSAPAKPGHRQGRGLARALARATAKESGLSLQTIRQDLRAGKTLDQIAGSKASAVAHDELAAIQTRLDAAVKAGRITQAQEASRLAKAAARIQTAMATELSGRTSK